MGSIHSLHYENFADGSVKCIEDEIPFELPDGWAWARLSSIADMALGKMLDVAKNKGSFRPYLRNINVRWGTFELSDVLEMRFEDDELERYSIRHGDLVICEGGEPGRCAVWQSEEVVFYQKALHRVRAIEVLPEYLCYAIRYFIISAHYERYYTGTTIKHLTGQALRILPIPLPPMGQQQLIVKQLQQMLEEIDRIEAEKTDALSLVALAKSEILDLAIRGQLVPQDPSDEPASVLLERIRAEKEDLIKQGKIKRDKKESIIFRGEDNSYYQKVESDGSTVIQRVDVPPTWAVCCLQEISYLVSTVGMQIKSEEIQNDGVFPVISQGQSFIDGYYSDESKVIYDIPIILFGDHTRNVKYIDFPFIVGADGTKLHKVIRANERFVYYWMCHASQCIADRGYARHYSFLLKECFTLPPIAEQIRIVNCIDQLFAQLDSIADALL